MPASLPRTVEASPAMLDLRMACLDSPAIRARPLTSVLGRSRPTTRLLAPRSPRSRPRIRCLLRATATRSTRRYPPPSDPVLRAQVDALARRSPHRARALRPPARASALAMPVRWRSSRALLAIRHRRRGVGPRPPADRRRPARIARGHGAPLRTGQAAGARPDDDRVGARLDPSSARCEAAAPSSRTVRPGPGRRSRSSARGGESPLPLRRRASTISHPARGRSSSRAGDLWPRRACAPQSPLQQPGFEHG